MYEHTHRCNHIQAHTPTHTPYLTTKVKDVGNSRKDTEHMDEELSPYWVKSLTKSTIKQKPQRKVGGYWADSLQRKQSANAYMRERPAVVKRYVGTMIWAQKSEK